MRVAFQSCITYILEHSQKYDKFHYFWCNHPRSRVHLLVDEMRRNVGETDVEMLRIRDPNAVEHWFLEYSDELYTFIYYRIGKDPDLAADLVEDTFMTALDNIKCYDPKRGSMFTWLRLLSRNCIKKSLRRRSQCSAYKQYWQRFDDTLVAGYSNLATEPLPGEVLERAETSELVQMTLTNMPDNYKRILKEYYYNEKSLKNIATILDITENAAKALLYRARMAFKTTFQTLAQLQTNPHLEKGAYDG